MGNALVLIQLITQGLTQLQGYGALLSKAHAEGRDVTEAELDDCMLKDDAARARLQELINASKGN